jgi:hypothetical protein
MKDETRLGLRIVDLTFLFLNKEGKQTGLSVEQAHR